MKSQFLLFSIVWLAMVAAPAQADIYKCTGSDGHITYSNQPLRDCKVIQLDPVGTAAPPSRSSTKAPTPSMFPRVDDSTQKARDNDRRRILESELAVEQKNLDAARKELASQESEVLPSERNVGGSINAAKVQDRLKSYKDKAALHERNIEAIRKEISNLR